MEKCIVWSRCSDLPEEKNARMLNNCSTSHIRSFAFNSGVYEIKSTMYTHFVREIWCVSKPLRKVNSPQSVWEFWHCNSSNYRVNLYDNHLISSYSFCVINVPETTRKACAHKEHTLKMKLHEGRKHRRKNTVWPCVHAHRSQNTSVE